MLHMPTPMLMGGAQGKTYADFEAHILAKAINGSSSWTSAFAGSGGPQKLTTLATSAFAGTMFGTTWGDGRPDRGYAWALTPTCRAMQHALPSAAEGLAQITAGRRIYYETVENYSLSPLYFLDRNGFLSSEFWDYDILAARIALVLYWDGERAMMTEPRLGVGPSPYNWI